MRLADRVMHDWLEQVLRRQRGEATGVRALSLVLSGHVTACCGMTPTSTKGGEAKCPACNLCGDALVLRSWCAPRSIERRARDGEIHVKETRTVNRGGEDTRLAREADRVLRLARLIEPRPPACSEFVWRRALAALGMVLLYGAIEPGSSEEAARFDQLRVHSFGTDWNTWVHRDLVRFAREVIEWRLLPKRKGRREPRWRQAA